MDSIFLQEALFSMHIGVSKQERLIDQPVVVTITMYTDTKKAATSDAIKDTINYDQVHAVIKHLTEEKEYKLIETAAEEMATVILTQFSKVEKVRLQLKKPAAMAHKHVAAAGIVITRSR